MERLSIGISNLTSASRVPHLEQIIRQQPGVTWAIANFAAGEVLIFYDPTVFEARQFTQVIGSLGYSLVLDGHTVTISQAHPAESKPLAFFRAWMRVLHIF